MFNRIWSAAFKYLCVLPTNPAGAPVVRDVANIESLLNSSPIAGVTNPDQSSVYVWPLDPSKWTNNLAFVSPWKIPVGAVNGPVYLLLLDALNSSIYPVNPLAPL